MKNFKMAMAKPTKAGPYVIAQVSPALRYTGMRAKKLLVSIPEQNDHGY